MQRLHLVFGGELVDPPATVFRDVNDLHVVGIFPDYRSAFDVWKAEAQRKVDNARMRHFIADLHAPRDEGTDAHPDGERGIDGWRRGRGLPGADGGWPERPPAPARPGCMPRGPSACARPAAAGLRAGDCGPARDGGALRVGCSRPVPEGRSAGRTPAKSKPGTALVRCPASARSRSRGLRGGLLAQPAPRRRCVWAGGDTGAGAADRRSRRGARQLLMALVDAAEDGCGDAGPARPRLAGSGGG